MLELCKATARSVITDTPISSAHLRCSALNMAIVAWYPSILLEVWLSAHAIGQDHGAFSIGSSSVAQIFITSSFSAIVLRLLTVLLRIIETGIHHGDASRRGESTRFDPLERWREGGHFNRVWPSSLSTNSS